MVADDTLSQLHIYGLTSGFKSMCITHQIKTGWLITYVGRYRHEHEVWLLRHVDACTRMHATFSVLIGMFTGHVVLSLHAPHLKPIQAM